MNAKTIRKLRKATQVFSFGLFIFLFIQAVYLDQSPLESDLFYRLDPLIAATAMIAGRTIIAGLLYSLINLLAALVFGRVWCGWICPMGTVLDWISPGTSNRKTKLSGKWRSGKYLLLAVLIVAAILGNQTLAITDPISILTRSLTTAIWPALRFMVFGIESFLYRFDFLWPVLDFTNAKLLLPLFQGIESVFIAAIPHFSVLPCDHCPKLDRRTFLVPVFMSAGRYAGDVLAQSIVQTRSYEYLHKLRFVRQKLPDGNDQQRRRICQ